MIKVCFDMKSGKKTILKAVLGLLALFALINASWYVWRSEKYGSYCKGWAKNLFATWIVPRYVYTDEDGYDYGVKYPDYLSFTGNLSVGLPTSSDNPFTDFMIVWPKVFGGYDYGVSIVKDGLEYQIYVNADGTAVHPEDSEIAASCKDTIDDLLGRAQEMWDLE